MAERTCAIEIQKKAKRERGATLVEYALLVALIAGVAVVSVRALGLSLRDNLSASAEEISDAGGCTFHPCSGG